MSSDELWPALAWCQANNVTLRFYLVDAVPHVRVATRIAPNADDYAAVLLPCDIGDTEALTDVLVAAREEIEPQLRRRTLRLVTEA
ncbi:MAG: hypothetical protein LH630_06330 [Actinomycetia bacterium]|nr:hypothetical protein [Actinomycetes bacterium]